jgi:hypothetical protein
MPLFSLEIVKMNNSTTKRAKSLRIALKCPQMTLSEYYQTILLPRLTKTDKEPIKKNNTNEINKQTIWERILKIKK